MKQLVELISMLTHHDALLKEEWERLRCTSVQSAYRASRMPIDNPYRCFWIQ